jgi:4-amino-4-deoxy-L-arabinose transferase-like glycosyltransferase
VGEWSLRFPAVLFGTLAILATFLFARRLFGNQVALLAAALLAFSVWGLELARYARMYTLLQLVFLLAAYAFVRGYLEGSRGWRLITWLWMALAVVTHQLGVMILLLFLVPAFLDDEILPADRRGPRRFLLLVPPAVLGVVWLAVHKVIGQLMVRTATAVGGEESEPVAPGILGLIEQHLRIPEMTMPLNLLGSDRMAIAWAAMILLVLGFAILVTGVRRPGERWRALMSLAILGAAFMNLFTVAIGLLVMSLVLFSGGWRQLCRPPWSIAIIGAAIFAVYWGVYLHLHPQLLDPGWGEPWSIGMVFTAYPPFKSRVLEWFLSGWPRMTLLVGVGIVGLTAIFVGDRRRYAALVAVAVLVLPLAVVTCGREVFNEVRYHFHLYPFILIIFAAVVVVLARGITAALDIALAAAGRSFQWRRAVEVLVMVAVVLTCSRDVSPGEMALLLERDYTTTKDPIRATLNWRPYAWFHQDHVAPATYVRDQLGPGDRVMFFGPTYWASIYLHYIGQVDYAVSEKATRIMRGDQVVHHVTGVRCLTSLDELDQVLASEREHRIWLLGDLNMLSDESASFTPAMKSRLREIATPWHYLGHDLNTLVRRIDADPPAPAYRTEEAARHHDGDRHVQAVDGLEARSR